MIGYVEIELLLYRYFIHICDFHFIQKTCAGSHELFKEAWWLISCINLSRQWYLDSWPNVILFFEDFKNEINILLDDLESSSPSCMEVLILPMWKPKQERLTFPEWEGILPADCLNFAALPSVSSLLAYPAYLGFIKPL